MRSFLSTFLSSSLLLPSGCGVAAIWASAGYRGVIYGHDPECSAPREWKEAMKVDLLTEGPNQPFYHVLVDTRDRPGGMSTYVAQENLRREVAPRPVVHPWVQKVRTRQCHRAVPSTVHTQHSAVLDRTVQYSTVNTVL